MLARITVYNEPNPLQLDMLTNPTQAAELSDVVGCVKCLLSTTEKPPCKFALCSELAYIHHRMDSIKINVQNDVKEKEV